LMAPGNVDEAGADASHMPHMTLPHAHARTNAHAHARTS
jgi:hypothetical protein